MCEGCAAWSRRWLRELARPSRPCVNALATILGELDGSSSAVKVVARATKVAARALKVFSSALNVAARALNVAALALNVAALALKVATVALNVAAPAVSLAARALKVAAENDERMATENTETHRNAVSVSLGVFGGHFSQFVTEKVAVLTKVPVLEALARICTTTLNVPVPRSVAELHSKVCAVPEAELVTAVMGSLVTLRVAGVKAPPFFEN